jgi:surfactin synthase thioesterase subunit
LARDPWLPALRPASSAPRLFCLPYAGGGASMFAPWPVAAAGRLDICPVHLPGRESRITETAFTNVDALVAAFVDRLVPHLDHPYAFFGHSMGALIAFETTRELRRRALPPPIRIVASAFRGPHLPERFPDRRALGDDAFIAELRRLAGTPDEVVADEEMMALLLPGLRADVTLCETYVHRDEDPLDVPLTVFGGAEDARVSREELEGWRRHTRAGMDLQLFPGHHFFLKSSRAAVVAAIADRLSPRG